MAGIIPHRFVVAVTACLAIIAAAGCRDGSGRVAVSGKVRVDGQPLASGVIRFVPAHGSAAPVAQAAVENGHYRLDPHHGPFAGPHRVEIESTGHWGVAFDDDVAFAQRTATQGGLPPDPIPPRYNRQSELAADIPDTDTEALDFDLVVTPARR